MGGFFCLVCKESTDHVAPNDRDDREYNGDGDIFVPRNINTE